MKLSVRAFLIVTFSLSLCSSRQITGAGEAAFFDSTAYSDAIRLTMTNVSQPPAGKEYVAWLVRDDDAQFTNLSTITVQGNGNVLLVYGDNSGANLIGVHKKILITRETSPFSGSIPTQTAIVFEDSFHSTGLPSSNSPLTRVRNCIVSFSNTAQNLGLAIWLKKHITGFLDHAGFARDGALNNNTGEARTHSDHVYDFIRGQLINPANGSIATNGDPVGYGYRRYGDLGMKDSAQGGAGSLGGAGYYVSLVVDDPLSTARMKISGESAQRALRNALGPANDSGWAKEVTDQALKIINGAYTSLPTEGAAFYILALKFINGTVSATDTASATGGIRQAYYHMQQMATFSLSAPKAVFVSSAASVDFGSIAVNSTKTDSVQIRNTGKNLLLIDSVQTTGEWYSVDPSTASVSPGDSIQFRITFAPGVAGTHSAFALFFNSSPSGIDTVSLQGSATPSSGIERDPSESKPGSFSLDQNFPNPFNPTTQIPFALPIASRVWVTVHDLLGREIARVIDGADLRAGAYRVSWSAGFAVSGVYFCKFEATARGEYRSFRQIRPMVLVK